MSPTSTSHIEHVALDGPIGLSIAIAIGAGLLALFAWALWRERRILGRNNTALFWLLRAAALVTVMWMLLAPNKVRVETSTTRRAIAVLTDVSGSMQTVDPPGTSDDLRWAVANPGDRQYVATRSADGAITAVGMMQQYLQSASEALNQHKPESQVVDATSSAADALQRARQNLQQVQDVAEPAGKCRTLARRVIRTLDGSEFEAFSQLCRSLRKGRTPSQKGWRESLPDLEQRVAGMRRSLHELARHAADEEAAQVARQSPARLTAVRNQPRLGRAADFVGSLQRTVLTSIQDKADVRLSSFDRSITRVSNPSEPGASLRGFLVGDDDVTPAGLGTNLSGVLAELNRDQQDQPLAAVVMLTDVAHNSSSEDDPRDVAAALTDTPVYVVPIGNTQHVRDVVLKSVYAPAVAMRNDDIVIEAGLQAYDCEGEQCVVQLLDDGKVVDFREVTLDSGVVSRRIRFEKHMPSIGNHRLQVAIEPLEGELTDENNYDEFEVNVTRSDIKVLLADEKPRWEYHYLARLFRRDDKVECDELLFQPRMIATGRRAATMTFPVSVDDWDQYDVVMLGDLPTAHLPVAAQESLVEYLKQRGGTLVMISGQEHMPHSYVDHPLEDILPVQPVDSTVRNADAFAFRVTDVGRDHHALMIGESEEATRIAWDFVNRFSPLHAVSTWRQPRPSAHTLIAAVPRDSLDPEADSKSSAFLCWQAVGRGRIVYLSGPDSYRLRLLRGDRLHYRFWGQLLRWAIASDLSTGTETVRIRTTKTRYKTNEDVHAVVRLTDAGGEPVMAASGLEVRITSGDDERTVPLTANPEIPGDYLAEVTSLDPGVYRIEPVGPEVDELQKDLETDRASASFTVQADPPLELVDTRCDRALAQQIADVTGGQVVPPTAVEEIVRLTNLDPIVSERIESRPLWLEWKYLWIVFGCLHTEWVIRKWKGLS